MLLLTGSARKVSDPGADLTRGYSHVRDADAAKTSKQTDNHARKQRLIKRHARSPTRTASSAPLSHPVAAVLPADAREGPKAQERQHRETYLANSQTTRIALQGPSAEPIYPWDIRTSNTRRFPVLRIYPRRQNPLLSEPTHSHESRPA